MRKPSLFPEREYGCYICDNPRVELHHIFYGTWRRAVSDTEGCTVWLCHDHHQHPVFGVHGYDKTLDKALKAECQRRWEEREGLQEPDHDTFIKRFGRNYL